MYKKTGVVFSFILLFILLHSTASGENLYSLYSPSKSGPVFPDKTWLKVKNPSDMGWSESELQKARKLFESSGARAFMIIEDGIVIAQWGDVSRKINCHSMRKSFLSALYGILASMGRVDLDETLQKIDIDDIGGLTREEKQARVVDLLMSRSGVYHPAAYETSSMKKKRPARGSHTPGSFFYYNNWDFNALGTIFEKKSGASIFKAFHDWIAEPIGMQDFRTGDGKYIKEDVSSHPAYPFYMSTRDRARFGLLFLRKGNWKGLQIIPPDWVEESTKPLSWTPRKVGYGYMWWVSPPGKKHLGVPFKGTVISARGHWGQFILIAPEHKLVVVQSVDRDGGDPKVSSSTFREMLKLILNAKKS